MTQSKRVLEVRNLSVALQTERMTRTIIDQVTFDLQSAQVLGIIGEAGAGKTVLARALANGLQEPLHIAGGQIFYRSRDFRSIPKSELRRLCGSEIGYIGANPSGSLDPTVPVGQQIVAKLRAVEPSLTRCEAKERVLEVLEAVHIPSPKVRFDERPFQFSGGMMQRIMIVDALVSRPTFLIADNITQALDVTVAAQINRLILELRDSFSTAIVYISSSLPTVCAVADEILVLQDGRIIESTKPKNLIAGPKHNYTKRLLTQLPRIWAAGFIAPQPKSAPLLLQVVDVAKTYRARKRGSFAGYNEVKAVRGVSIEVKEGENLGIVGESGCGKSTLTRLLAWLEAPDQGSIFFQGQNLKQLRRHELKNMRKSFQLLLQDPYSCLPARVPIWRIIAEPLRIHGLGTKAEIRHRVEEAMVEVGLDPSTGNELTVGLSAGQRQRVNIARALVLKPKLLILDETLSSLDPIEQSRLLELFDCLQKAHQFTYIFISHDLALVRKVCQRIAVMYLGRFVEIVSNAALFENPGHPYSRALLSAVPTLDDNPFKAGEHLLDGEPPSPVDVPPGCSFRSRCPSAQPICAVRDPENYSSNQFESIACHLKRSA